MQVQAESAVLSLRGVSRRYGAVVAVDSASFDLQPGRTTCLLGPSGSGKSTILRMIAGLEPVDEGEINIGGHCVSSAQGTIAPERRGVGVVFQDNALFPHLDVAANVGFGLRHLGAAERSARVTALLGQFHIAHLARSWPHMLSGGEQQRVAIARALAREPALLLLDEPFSGLDGALRQRVRDAVLGDLRRAGASVLIVTHDPDEALAISDELILMASGRIMQQGAPQQCYQHPRSLAAARLLGEYLQFDGEIRGGKIETVLGAQDTGGLVDGPAQLGLRPAALHLDSTGVQATITDVRFAGPCYQLTVQLGGTQIHLDVPTGDYRAGQTVGLRYDPAAAAIYS